MLLLLRQGLIRHLSEHPSPGLGVWFTAALHLGLAWTGIARVSEEEGRRVPSTGGDGRGVTPGCEL